MHQHYSGNEAELEPEQKQEEEEDDEEEEEQGAERDSSSIVMAHKNEKQNGFSFQEQHDSRDSSFRSSGKRGGQSEPAPPSVSVPKLPKPKGGGIVNQDRSPWK